MSGIAGIVYNDGCPADPQLIRQMTRMLVFRGPDAQEVRTFECVGLGHALLRIPPDNSQQLQPASLNQQTWITADARLDAHEELAEALRARNKEVSPRAPDWELLLHMYAAWGEACVEHIAGDFVFAIWDSGQRKLFCACDHFGIKTLYFAELGNCLVFSNSLECVRAHPEVSDRLNDAAIADFLLFGMNYDSGKTSFADIRRLPPAHTLRWSAEGLECRRYWMPPTDKHIRYRRRAEYVEQFGELLKKAVADRLPPDNAGILLSGGLDSSSVAATAGELRGEKFPELRLHAFTAVASDDASDRDLTAARAVANALKIPLHTTSLAGAKLFENWEDTDSRWAEPTEDPFAAKFLEQFREIAQRVRVVFSGEGSDNLMEFEMGQHIRSLWREGRFGRLGFDIAEHIIARFRAPDGVCGPLRRIGRLASKRKTGAAIPPWLDSELISRLNLESRWASPVADLPWSLHPVHPKAYGSLFFPQWKYLFQQESAEVTRQPVEVRYPFLDLRIVNFMLAIPALPWFFRKHILREAMRGKLPEQIRMRPKRPMLKDPVVEALCAGGTGEVELRRLSEELSGYVAAERLHPLLEDDDSEEVMLRLRPYCLSYWLQSPSRIGYKMPMGIRHAEAKAASR